MKTLRFALLASFILAIISCKKDTFDPTSVEDAATAETMFEDLDKVVEDVIKEQGTLMRTGAYEVIGPCPAVTIEWTNGNQFPATLTLDFGTTDCTGEDGRARRGVVRALISGLFMDSGTVVTITPDNYFVDNHRVEGTKVVTNTGQSSQAHWTFSVAIDGKVTRPDGAEIQWESTRTHEWVEGDATATLLDDVYHVNGYGKGVDSEGRGFRVTITETLEIHLDCKWIEAGEIRLIPDDLPPRILNYGTGGCDNIATAQVGLIKVEIKLK